MCAILLAVATLAGCFAARRPNGVQCVFNGDCAENLICAARVCRPECRTDRDCPMGQTCLPSGQPDKRVCLPADAQRPCQFSEECPAPQICTRDGVCGPQCRTDVDCVLFVPDSRCVCVQGVATCSFHPAASADGGAGADAQACPPGDGGMP